MLFSASGTYLHYSNRSVPRDPSVLQTERQYTGGSRKVMQFPERPRRGRDTRHPRMHPRPQRGRGLVSPEDRAARHRAPPYRLRTIFVYNLLENSAELQLSHNNAMQSRRIGWLAEYDTLTNISVTYRAVPV